SVGSTQRWLGSRRSSQLGLRSSRRRVERVDLPMLWRAGVGSARAFRCRDARRCWPVAKQLLPARDLPVVARRARRSALRLAPIAPTPTVRPASRRRAALARAGLRFDEPRLGHRRVASSRLLVRVARASKDAFQPMWLARRAPT